MAKTKYDMTVLKDEINRLLFIEKISLTEICKQLTKNTGYNITGDILIHYLKTHKIDYLNRDVVRKPSSFNYSAALKCNYCNRPMINIRDHHSECRTKKNYDYLEQYKDKIIHDLKTTGLGINKVCERLNIDSTRQIIQNFLK